MPCGVFKLRNLRSSARVSPQKLEAFVIPNFRACVAAGLCPPMTGESPVTTLPRHFEIAGPSNGGNREAGPWASATNVLTHFLRVPSCPWWLTLLQTDPQLRIAITAVTL